MPHRERAWLALVLTAAVGAAPACKDGGGGGGDGGSDTGAGRSCGAPDGPGSDGCTPEPGADCSVTDVSGGERHTCALLADGTVKCWGSNNVGQLGLGDLFTRGEEPDEMGDDLQALRLGNRGAVTHLAAGAIHTCALFSDGTVSCWGSNNLGQLGLGDTEARGDDPGEMDASLPAVDLGTGASVTALSAGWAHTCALLAGGAVKCWGNNWKGELGLGDTEGRGDEPGEMGDDLPAVDLGAGNLATAIVSGQDHSCALLAGGAVKCWGSGVKGQLGLGSPANRGDQPEEMGESLPAVDLGSGRTATALAAGKLHTCALLDDATIKCWGSSGEGQLGLGDVEARGDQPGEMGDALPALDLGTAGIPIAITAGYAHTCALLADHSARCWGSNWDGQLGLGDTDHRGDEPGEMGTNLRAIDLGAGGSIVAMRTGSFHTCAVLANGTLKCWGGNFSGQLGQNDPERRGDDPDEMGDKLHPVALASGDGGTCSPTLSAQACSLPSGKKCPVTGVSAGAGHTCAWLESGDVKCWGANDAGQLGLGDDYNRGEEPDEMGARLPAIPLGSGLSILQVAARGKRSCALFAGGTLKCWGDSPDGELGLGDTQSRGLLPGEMGDSLPAVDLGPNSSAIAFAAGWEHTCALLEGGSIKCWGHGHRGQLGVGDAESRGDQAGEMGSDLPAVKLGKGETAIAVAAGWGHSCALLAGGGVKCWGYNWNGQLGQGTSADLGDDPGEMEALVPVSLGMDKTAVAIAAGWGHTCALLDDGRVKCWGDNLEGQLGLGDESSRGDTPGEMGNHLPPVDLGTGKLAVAITAGFAHTCALLKGGDVKCWGWNYDEQLGTGDDHDRGDGPNEMGDDLPPVDLGSGRKAVAISAGQDHTCALLDDGSVKCWGGNHSGQLGAGDAESRGHEPADMGDNLAPVELCSCQE